MMKKRGMSKKLLELLNSKPVIGVLIFTILSLASVFAANVIVQDGSLEVESGLNISSGNLTFPDGSTQSSGVPSGALMYFAGNNTPTGWLPCDGSNVSRSTYPYLFSTIGTIYGNGDGSTTFNLPDLQGRVPIVNGTGTDINSNSSSFSIGESAGEFNHTLTEAEMPAHVHTQMGSQAIDYGGGPNTNAPQNNVVNTGSTGGDQPHNIMQPYLVLNCIVKT